MSATMKACSLALLLLACSDVSNAKPAIKKMAPPMDPISVEWTLTKDVPHNQLSLSYTVTNRGTKPVFLLDQLVVPTAKGLEPAFDRVIVQNGEGDAVALVRGYVAPERPIGGVYPPGARLLDSGKKLTGSASIPLPLVAWHNFATPTPLKDQRKHATFEVGYLIGHERWGEVPLTTGTKLGVPNPPYVTTQQFAKGETKSLP